MKKYFLFLGIAFSSYVFAQNSEQSAGIISCPSIAYPKEALVRKEEGTVELLFKILQDSSLGDILVRKSSGFASLDDAAVNHIKGCSFRPEIKNSIIKDSFVSQKFTYKLDDDDKKQSDKLKRAENLKRMAELASSSPLPQQNFYRPPVGYHNLIVQRITPNLVFSKEIEGNPRASVEIKTAPDGNIIGVKLSSSSGDVDWDQAVLKAVIRTKSLPLDSNGKVPEVLEIGFRPKR